MKLCIALVVLVAVAACKEDSNPSICCTDEADCAAAQIPAGTSCQPGYSCRGHLCVVEVCETSGNCNPTSPYCVVDDGGRCQPDCTTDSECPGFSQSGDQQYCETGTCVACRADGADCGVETPVCDAGACRRCQQHNECASGVCTADGSCAEDGEIARIAPAGSATSDCTAAAPCTLARAIALTPVRRYVLVGVGTYQLPGSVELDGNWHFVGAGTALPTFTNLVAGPVFRVVRTGNVTFDRVRVTGARQSSPTVPDGYGVQCRETSAGAVHIVDSLFDGNETSGVETSRCTFTARRSQFRNNGRSGVELVESNATVDGCEFSGSERGLFLDFGLFTVRNSFIHHNNEIGVDLYVNQAGTAFEFNTVVDNGQGIQCSVGTYPNNIIARNQYNGCVSPCSCPDSIFAGTDLSDLKFKAPDASPPDYHLTAGSIAIDAAAASTLDHDVDGDPRPVGAGRDVGADEYRP